MFVLAGGAAVFGAGGGMLVLGAGAGPVLAVLLARAVVLRAGRVLVLVSVLVLVTARARMLVLKVKNRKRCCAGSQQGRLSASKPHA